MKEILCLFPTLKNVFFYLWSDYDGSISRRLGPEMPINITRVPCERMEGCML